MLRAIFAALFTLTVCAFAQGITATAALRLLPNDARKNLARIEGRDGAPWPERWYFLVHDASQPLGLREYAVADGELKANRTISQFADELKPTDIIGGSSIEFDSGAVASLAARFCVANGARLGSIDYELGKYAEGGAPAWRATVLNAKGDQLGMLIINTKTGVVERHDGFDNAPVEIADIEEKKTPPATPKVANPPAKAATTTKPATTATSTKPASPAATPKPAVAASTKKPSSPEALLQKPFLASKPAEKPAAPTKVATPEKPRPPVAAAAPTPRPNALKRLGTSVGGGVKKLFGN
jgi:hypothetical protein